jgi:hypothetical protein
MHAIADTVFDTFPWPQFEPGSRRRESAETGSHANTVRELTFAATNTVPALVRPRLRIAASVRFG